MKLVEGNEKTVGAGGQFSILRKAAEPTPVKLAVCIV